jgi:membrane-associated phospholipid phosphatase
MNVWPHITLFGDISISLLVAAAIAGWLTVEDEKRLALGWALLFGAGMVVVLVSKMAFIGWGVGVRSLDFTGISGHAMRAAAVYPVLLYLVLERAGKRARGFGVALGIGFGLLVSLSRLAVEVHSIADVVAGWLLGAAVSAAFLWIATRTLRKHIFNPLRIALVSLALLPAPYVHPAPTQQWLTRITLYVAGTDEAFLRAGAHAPHALP